MGSILQEALLLVKFSPLGLQFIIFWRSEEKLWECQFVTEDDFHYIALDEQPRLAIEKAMRQVPQ